MTGTNQFVPFAIATGANVLTPASYQALGPRQQGFQTGVLLAQHLNTTLRQPSVMAAMLGGFIADAGFDALDNGDLDGLLTNYKAAIQAIAANAVPNSERVHGGQDTGTANTIVATVSPAIGSYDFQALYLIRIAATNSGPSSVNLNGIGARPLVRMDGTQVRAGDVVAGSVVPFVYNGSAFQLVGLGQAEVQRIVPSVTLYVRPDGNDANDGLTNTPTGAFLTPAAAMQSAGKYYVPSGSILIQLGTPGVYPAPNNIPLSGTSFIIQGDVNNQDAYQLAGPGAPAVGLINVNTGVVRLMGVQLNNTGNQIHTLQCVTGGSAILQNVTFLCQGTNSNYHTAAFSGGFLQVGTGCKFASSMGGMVFVDGGQAVMGGALSVINTPAWSGGGVTALRQGRCVRVDATFSGAATGRRYYVDGGGLIESNGAGVNFIPGDTPGFVGTLTPPYFA